jgi:RNA polymerase sigma-70 factor (ECF subfamily)
MADDDPGLIRRWRSGDAAGFDALVRRWQQPVARFLARLLGGNAPVADLCQDVFLRVYLSRERYREEGHFSTWLYRIALNLGRDHARRQVRQPVALPEEAIVVAAKDGHCWERHEIEESVEIALSRLTPPLREVLVLRHYEDVNFEEMARLLETPASTLKSRFAVALRQMQAILKTLGWGEDDGEAKS